MPPYTCWDDCYRYQNDKREQMLVRMWKKGNTYTTADGNVKLYIAITEQSGSSSEKLKLELS